MNPFAHFQALYGDLDLSPNDAALHVFLSGWNTAMHEMMQRVNAMPFGNDTRASFAVYFQSQMVDVSEIEKEKMQRTWVGLTDEERNKLWRDLIKWGDPSHDDEDLMKAIEDKLRKKNT